MFQSLLDKYKGLGSASRLGRGIFQCAQAAYEDSAARARGRGAPVAPSLVE
jgi:hypothetical protein